MSDWTSLEDWTRDYVRALTGKGIAPGLERVRSDGIRAALTQDSISAGDALVPVNVAESIGMVSLTSGSLRALCTQWPMTSSVEHVAALYDDNHSTNAPYGVSFRYVDEGDNPTDGDPDWMQVRLDASEDLIATTTINAPLVEDSAPAFAAAMDRVFGNALEFDVERRIIRGEGHGIAGVLHSPAMLEVGRSTANNISRGDVSEMLGRLLPGCWRSAIWLVSPSAMDDLGDNARIFVDGDGADGTMTIAGRPVFPSEHCSALGTTGDIILMDPRAYYIGDREQLTVSLSPHPEFRSHRTVLKATARLAGSPGIVSSVTPAQGTNALSAFVSL